MNTSLYVIRERETHNYWDGFGFAKCLEDARTYSQPPQPLDYSFITIPVDVLELRLIVREPAS